MSHITVDNATTYPFSTYTPGEGLSQRSLVDQDSYIAASVWLLRGDAGYGGGDAVWMP
jgi:hypothetical protein